MSAATAHAFGEPLDLPMVVGVDGSERSLRAVDWAADEAALRGASLRLVHASLWERYEGTTPTADTEEPSEELMAEDVVEAAERRAHRRQPGVKVFTDVLPEEPEYALTRESRSALLLVLGCRGRSGMAEALLGSVSVAVAGHAHCPVIVLRANHSGEARPQAHGRIVLGVGDSPAGSAAVRFAVEESLLRGVPLEAVRAWRRRHPYEQHAQPPTTGGPAHPQERQARDLVEEALHDCPAGLQKRCRTVEGRAQDVLPAAAHGADLLVVGARRRPGHFGLQLGRVAHRALHHADCPVAVVPEPAWEGDRTRRRDGPAPAPPAHGQHTETG
ncbi:Nucleotide-binding universal stress protein, UspA family [Streptomyces sp. 2231.1]|uniref:universal stress protein n=1 Tax=Streptomyces sp. 2231.1 TaxID=1855347 RepID=UPI00089BC3C9|nr:universal stress protein [Streptomyces sp. 2231.1]SEC16265.1 Nucleotide-binding universal stress protein, UspA family [Streptomyces sp. 2231.1]